jgi:hypothetical protein
VEETLLNLDPGTFGGTKACHILVEMLNRSDDLTTSKSVVTVFNKYFAAVGELLKLDNPTRDQILQLYLEDTIRRCEVPNGVRQKLEKNNINFTYFHNILTSRMRQASEHGALLEKFRGKDLEHSQILFELRMLARAASKE